MKKWKIIVPAALVSVTALSFALARKKTAPATDATPSKPANKLKPVNVSEGHYSFVSGFKDAVTVDVKVCYDADNFDFNVVEDGFLCYTGDSHVAVMYGSNINLQFEYTPFYSGDDFEKLREGCKDAHPGYACVSSGFRYVDGDSVYICLPVDGYSYLLITAMLSKGSELKFEDLADAPELAGLISGISISLGN